jgi:hypothetical protein
MAKESDEAGKTVIARTQRQRAAMLDAVAAELEESRKRLRPLPSTYGDLSDLPEEVLAELNLTKVDELEQQLRDIVASGDGAEVGLDAIIIELYRRHKGIHPRRFIMNKLYRMAQKELIYSVEGRKGVYYVPKARPQPAAFDTDLDDDVPF